METSGLKSKDKGRGSIFANVWLCFEAFLPTCEVPNFGSQKAQWLVLLVWSLVAVAKRVEGFANPAWPCKNCRTTEGIGAPPRRPGCWCGASPLHRLPNYQTNDENLHRQRVLH